MVSLGIDRSQKPSMLQTIDTPLHPWVGLQRTSGPWTIGGTFDNVALNKDKTISPFVEMDPNWRLYGCGEAISRGSSTKWRGLFFRLKKLGGPTSAPMVMEGSVPPPQGLLAS